MDFLAFGMTLLLPVASLVLGYLRDRWRDKHKRRLVLKSYPPERLLQVSDSVRSDISIAFQGKEIKDLARFKFSIHNTGRDPILKSDVVSPIKIRINRPVLNVVNHSESPHFDISSDPRRNGIVIQWDLFNQGCSAMFDVICESVTEPVDAALDYQIAGVPRIKEETVSQYEIEEDKQPPIVKILDYVLFYIPGSIFVVFSFWFWLRSDSITDDLKKAKEYHLLLDLTWIAMSFGIIAGAFLVGSFFSWFYRELIKRW